MIPFIDLRPIHQQLGDELRAAVDRVLHRGCFILGPELEALERSFADFQGGGHVVGVANGTDALELSLRVLDIGPGDEVITVSHSSIATVTAIERVGAKPVLVEIEPDTFTLSPDAASAAITPRTRAILPVHAYGHPANLETLTKICRANDLALIEDCAQAPGARYRGKRVGTYGDLAAFSFHPTNNLGACGNGGAIWTGDSQLAVRLRRLRNYGQADRYSHLERGMSSQLDEIQAAILRVKLEHLETQTRARQDLAAEYGRRLTGVFPPVVRPDAEHVYHLYVVRSTNRHTMRVGLTQAGIQTLLHYPVPIHLQPASADLGYRPGSLPVTERVCKEIITLPLYVGMTREQVLTVAETISRIVSERSAA